MGKNIFIIAALVLFNIACASKPCREPQSPAAEALATPTEAHAFVGKSDGTKQCDKKKGVAPEAMEKQLKDIKVYSKTSKTDGKMRTQVCGADAGYFNVFEIDASNVEKAKALGFKEWSN